MQVLKIFSVLVISLGLFSGVRYIGSTIHYSCHREPLVNVDGGDDCAPPIMGIGELGFYMTGGSFNPLWNRDTITVRNIHWIIEKVAGSETEEQAIAADVTTYDGKTKRYDLGVAHGCSGTSQSELEDHEIVIGRVRCNFAESLTTFLAFGPHGHFRIERYDESAKDGSIATTTLVKI